MRYRQARSSDVAAMAEIRAGDWGTEEYWQGRILAYMIHQSHPRFALRPRVLFVCLAGERLVGFIAGHLTQRFGCDGELEWISIRPEYRGRGIAFELLHRLSEWFVRQDAKRICVDVEPSNQRARRFYRRNGAHHLKPSWMVWDDISCVVQNGREVSD